jgi:hypothetical protein
MRSYLAEVVHGILVQALVGVCEHPGSGVSIFGQLQLLLATL